jgi:hypothetical protein
LAMTSDAVLGYLAGETAAAVITSFATREGS